MLEVEKDTHEEAHVPQDTEKEEEATQIDTEASQASASGQDNCEESEVSEGRPVVQLPRPRPAGGSWENFQTLSQPAGAQ